jgi:hypothetical protein
MAWFLNHYTCYRCGKDWSDDWSCMCDGNEFVALRSPDTAEYDPDYREVGRFPTREKAGEFLASLQPSNRTTGISEITP